MQGLCWVVQAAGFLSGDADTDRFLRLSADIAVRQCLEGEAAPVRPALNMAPIDAFARLVSTLALAHGGGPALALRAARAVAGVALRDGATRGFEFNGRPCFRLFIGLIAELTSGESGDTNALGMLGALATALESLQPCRLPGFAFPWLELIAHRLPPPPFLAS